VASGVALHPEFIQRTISTPHSSGFVRFELELFNLPLKATLYRELNIYGMLIHCLSNEKGIIKFK
jgi:hypothetical protein